MAGVIGSKLFSDVPWGTYQPGDIYHVKDGLYMVMRSYNGLDAYTFKASAAGVMTGGSSLALVGGYLPSYSHPVCVNSTDHIYAVWSYEQYYYYKISTFKVNDDGTMTNLGNTVWYGASGLGSPSGYPVRVSGTTYAVLFKDYSTTGSICIRTFTVSADGLTRSSIGIGPNVDLGNSGAFDLQWVAGSVYAVICQSPGGNIQVRTYNITGAGVVTFLNTLTLESGATYGNDGPKICRVKGTVWAAAYSIVTPATFRVRTFTMNDDGTFGSILYTQDGLWGAANSRSVYQFYSIPAGAFALSYGGTGGCLFETFAISDDGVPGTAIISSAAGAGGYAVYLCPYGGYPFASTILIGWYVDGSWNRKLVSYGVSLGISYNPCARVSGIRHVYRPGSYRAEVTFGDISMDSSMVKSDVVLPPAPEQSKPEETTTPQTITVPSKTADEVKAALKDEGLGYATVDRKKTDLAFLKYGYTTSDVEKWIKQGLSPQEILKKMQSYTGAKVDTKKTEPALKKIGLTTGQTMDLLKQEKLQPKDIIEGTNAAVKRAKAFNKYGYSEAEVRAMIKGGMQPGEIVNYMMAHPK